MPFDYTDADHDLLGADFKHLLETMRVCEDGLGATVSAEFDLAHTSTGLDLAELVAVETYVTDRFLPQLRNAIAGRRKVVIDPFDTVGVI